MHAKLYMVRVVSACCRVYSIIIMIIMIFNYVRRKQKTGRKRRRVLLFGCPLRLAVRRTAACGAAVDMSAYRSAYDNLHVDAPHPMAMLI